MPDSNYLTVTTTLGGDRHIPEVAIPSTGYGKYVNTMY